MLSQLSPEHARHAFGKESVAVALECPDSQEPEIYAVGHAK